MSRNWLCIKFKMRDDQGEQNNENTTVHHHPHFDPNIVKYSAEFVSDKSFLEYLDKNGYHFNDKLAEYASEMMENTDGKPHTWNTNQVKKAFESLGLDLPSHVTWGDVTYAANMAYADYYPYLLKDENSCIKYAYLTASDVDGYEGMIFYRWISDMMGKLIKIDWKKFI